MSNHARQGSGSTRQDILFSVHPGSLENTPQIQIIRLDRDRNLIELNDLALYFAIICDDGNAFNLDETYIVSIKVRPRRILGRIVFISSFIVSLIENSDNDRPRTYHHTIPQQPYHNVFKATEVNCLQRAANSNETAMERIQRQQVVIGSQLQRINECLNHTTSSHTSDVGAYRPQRGPNVNGLLQGVGSQFDGVSGPNP